MDLDAYVLAHHADWSRLEELLGRRRLDGDEADELVERYQQVATHLSVLRSAAPDPTLVAHLSSLLARARNKSVGARVSSWRGVAHFFTDRFPAALYRLRFWWLGCMAANVVVAAVMMWWLLDHPDVEQSLLSPDQVDQLVNNDFEGYYSEYAASHFAAQVWVNNAWVTALCLGLGILGLPLVKVLFDNIANLAIIGSIMMRHDRGELFWGLILPARAARADRRLRGRRRGAAAVLVVGRARRPVPRRRRSPARAGPPAPWRSGLVAVLLVSGVIEAFVTPSGLPTWARVGIGILAEAAFFAYVFVLGRAAYLRGETGDVDASLLEDRVASRG